MIFFSGLRLKIAEGYKFQIMNVIGEVFVDNFSDIANTTDNCGDDCKSKILGFWIEGVAVPCIVLLAVLVSKLNKCNCPFLLHFVLYFIL